MKQPVEVVVMGHRLTVTSDDGAAHVREVAEDVDREMRQLAAGHTSTTTVQLALITALNIASRYRKLALEQEELQGALDRLSRRVSETIDTGDLARRREKESANPGMRTEDSPAPAVVDKANVG